MNKQKFKQYAELDEEIKQLNDKKKELKKEILQEMVDNEAKTIKADFGTFSIREMKRWKYSDEYKKQEEKLKEKIKKFTEPIEKTLEELKKKEQEQGKAEVVINETLSFRAKK